MVNLILCLVKIQAVSIQCFYTVAPFPRPPLDGSVISVIVSIKVGH